MRLNGRRDAETLPVLFITPFFVLLASKNLSSSTQLENEAIFGALRQLNRANVPCLDGMVRCDFGLIGEETTTTTKS